MYAGHSLRTGDPWRDLSPELGDWENTHRRFCRWRDCKIHPHAASAEGGNEAMILKEGRLKNTSVRERMVYRSELLLQKVPERIAKRPVRYMSPRPGAWRVFSAKQVNLVAGLSARQRKVVKYYATMTESSTKSGILSRMLFCISSAGGELLTVCQKMYFFSYRRLNQIHIFVDKHNLTTLSSNINWKS